MTQEIWKPVVGFETHYEVSNQGRVRRSKAGKRTEIGRILRPQDTRGYKYVLLHVFGIGHKRNIHHLVADAFIGIRPKGYQCNHKDGNPANNTPENLEWVTPKENIRHAISILGRWRHHEHNSFAHTDEKTVAEIRALWATGEHTQKSLAKRFNMSHSNVNYIVNNVTWKD